MLTTKTSDQLELQVIYEEDKVEKNYTAYVPALRIGVIGESIEEARSNIQDLIRIELLERNDKLPHSDAIIETIVIQLSVS